MGGPGPPPPPPEAGGSSAGGDGGDKALQNNNNFVLAERALLECMGLNPVAANVFANICSGAYTNLRNGKYDAFLNKVGIVGGKDGIPQGTGETSSGKPPPANPRTEGSNNRPVGSSRNFTPRNSTEAVALKTKPSVKDPSESAEWNDLIISDIWGQFPEDFLTQTT